uniref:PB1 domain-containing protein n=2 Tax=Oryza TaxID=4527 RepID=Q2QN50_ORYSJ|nr:hypothetical protein LOC_Os12g38980 [Oryza sativa Japonica Group]
MEEIFMEEVNRTNHSELKLVVRVGSFFSLPDEGPKTYMEGKTLPTQLVDMHNYDLLELVNFIAEHFIWGSKQYMTLWCSMDGDSVEITSDEQLLDWFQLNLEKGDVSSFSEEVQVWVLLLPLIVMEMEVEVEVVLLVVVGGEEQVLLLPLVEVEVVVVVVGGEGEEEEGG